MRGREREGGRERESNELQSKRRVGCEDVRWKSWRRGGWERKERERVKEREKEKGRGIDCAANQLALHPPLRWTWLDFDAHSRPFHPTQSRGRE